MPGGNGWPGAQASYLSGFSINIDDEIRFFLTEAKAAAKVVADKMVGNLTQNTGKRLARDANMATKNPYFMMFADDNMEAYKEVIFWRKYSKSTRCRSRFCWR